VDSNWDTLWIALAGGAVGSIITALIAYGAKFVSARSDVLAHDRGARERDQDLKSWVADRSVALQQELREITDAMSTQNLSYSSAYGKAFARAKERALEEYRDQERQALRDVARMREAEGMFHRIWRKLMRRGVPELTAPPEVSSFLNLWRAPVSRHNQGGLPIAVRDPTTERFEEARAATEVNATDFF
jgi:hypothetical protein